MTIEDLIRVIKQAFHGVEQPMEITLHVAEAHDRYDYESNNKHRAKDHIGAWEGVPDEHMQKCSNALCYVDKVGMRYYLPAYMIWTLQNLSNEEYDLDYVLYALDNHPNDSQLSEHHKEKFSLFSTDQMKACALFVKFCAEDEQDYTDAYFAKKKYERYWYKYA